MVDTVTTQWQQNGPRNAQLLITSRSDGTGENAVKKIDASATGPLGVTVAGQTFYPGKHLVIDRIDYDIGNMGVLLQWEGSPSNEDFLPLAAGSQYFRDYREIGGLRVPQGLAGVTGSILLTTINAVPFATYMIVFWLRKNVP